MAEGSAPAPPGVSVALARPRRFSAFDLGTRVVGFAATLSTAVLVFLMLAFIGGYALPAIRFNGLHFFTGLTWNIGNQYGGTPTIRNGVVGAPGADFGIAVFAFGTVVSSALAMLIATPLAYLTAAALAFRIPRRVRPIVNPLVELMAGVPSVVYGLWGIAVLVPWIGGSLGPLVAGHFGAIPFLGGSTGSGYGLLAAGAILAIMVFPIMAATMRDVMVRFPASVVEGSIALGSTSWQAVTRVVTPAVRTGLLAAMTLALGRAIGETMAVLMVSGSALGEFPQNLFQPINTMAAVIVSQLDSALTDPTGIAQRSLAELALALFVITLAVNIVGRGLMGSRDRVRRTP